MHEEITLTTPALLFSAISLIMLAYTNRFLGYATLIRTLHEKFKSNPNAVLLTMGNECDIYSYLSVPRTTECISICFVDAVLKCTAIVKPSLGMKALLVVQSYISEL